MKCPTCVEEGEKSLVYSGGRSMTCMGGGAPYWDEDGEYHSHDPNTISTRYSCSRGHVWGKTSKISCPAPGCDWE